GRAARARFPLRPISSRCAPSRRSSYRSFRPGDEAAAEELLDHTPPPGALGAETGITDLVDAREDQHEPEHRQRERGTREEERPPLTLKDAGVRLRPVERDAPARLRHVAEAEELEAAVGE